MRKMKKLTTAITGAVLVFSVLFMPVISRAESGLVAIKKDLIWSNIIFSEDCSEFGYDEFATTSVTVYADEDMEVFSGYSLYADVYEVSKCNKYYEIIGRDLIKKEYEGMKAIDVWIAFKLYPDAGDIVEIEFPFPVPNGAIFDLNEGWSVDKISGNMLTLKCTDPIFYISMKIYYSDRPGEDQFWFKPMKTQLAIAADIVATKGGAAVAEASGDFSLSYEIMKYLDDHPGVTLKYTLTYKGEEHLIVIPGGGKYADPEIPWYGPEYLIGKFPATVEYE